MNRRNFLQVSATAALAACSRPAAQAQAAAVPFAPRTWPADAEAAFQARRRNFLEYVIAHDDHPRVSVWGPYRCFDFYALAHLALARKPATAQRLMTETLDMIDENLADEARDPSYKWHLADFALHPLLRAHLQFSKNAPGFPWERFEKLARAFRFHFGDLSENHNLLHLAGRYLVAQLWPDATFLDRRPAAVHSAESRKAMLDWMDRWVTQGSQEWGSDIYANVNFLALFNLFDFAADPDLRKGAQGILDLFLLDQAVDDFAGAPLGAARRGYGCYRVDPFQSPARPLHHLYFGTGGDRPFNLNFIGGVLEAAASSYRPPLLLQAIAADRSGKPSAATHGVGVWPVPKGQSPAGSDHLSRTTHRQPEAMLSVMNSFGSTGRYTEQVWQASFSESAIVFSNHPTLNWPGFKYMGPQNLLDFYDTGGPGGENPLWTIGNVPPGDRGDLRPGFWQGNTHGPRSFGQGPLALLIYQIPPDDPLPFAHLFFPRKAFDELIEKDDWIFARHNEGYLALFLPTGHRWITRGTWKNIELRLNSPTAAILAYVGGKSTHGTFDKFRSAAEALSPAWDPSIPRLSATPPLGQRIDLEYLAGPTQAGRPISTRGNRFDTPFGRLAMGERRMQLTAGGASEMIDLSFLGER